MIGWVRSQSRMTGCSIDPTGSMGTSPGTALTRTKRPGPTFGGETLSSTTAS